MLCAPSASAATEAAASALTFITEALWCSECTHLVVPGERAPLIGATACAAAAGKRIVSALWCANALSPTTCANALRPTPLPRAIIAQPWKCPVLERSSSLRFSAPLRPGDSRPSSVLTQKLIPRCHRPLLRQFSSSCGLST